MNHYSFKRVLAVFGVVGLMLSVMWTVLPQSIHAHKQHVTPVVQNAPVWEPNRAF